MTLLQPLGAQTLQLQGRKKYFGGVWRVLTTASIASFNRTPKNILMLARIFVL